MHDFRVPVPDSCHCGVVDYPEWCGASVLYIRGIVECIFGHLMRGYHHHISLGDKLYAVICAVGVIDFTPRVYALIQSINLAVGVLDTNKFPCSDDVEAVCRLPFSLAAGCEDKYGDKKDIM